MELISWEIDHSTVFIVDQYSVRNFVVKDLSRLNGLQHTYEQYISSMLFELIKHSSSALLVLLNQQQQHHNLQNSASPSPTTAISPDILTARWAEVSFRGELCFVGEGPTGMLTGCSVRLCWIKSLYACEI